MNEKRGAEYNLPFKCIGGNINVVSGKYNYGTVL